MIFSRKKKSYRFRGVDRKWLSDEQHSNDYNESEHIGRVCFGQLCFYYRDLGVRYWVPYEYIERAFIRISECPEDEFSNNQCYYRLILVRGEKEFANLIFNEEEPADRALAKLSERCPDMAVGVKK